MPAGGYPESYEKDKPITGLDQVPGDVKVFHAGTRLDDGRVLTSGGRVLCVVGLGDSVGEARQRAYDGVSRISWPEEFHRNDIGHRAIARE